MHKILLVLSFMLVGHSLSAQFSLSPVEKNIHGKLLKIDNGIPEAINNLPDSNGIKYWLRAYYYFIESRLGAGNSDVEDFIGKTDQLIDSIKMLDKASPLYNYCLTDIYMFRFFTYMSNESYFNAITQLYVSERFFQKNKELYPDFHLNRKHETIFTSIHFLISQNIPLIAGSIEPSDSKTYFLLLKNYPKAFNDDYNFKEEAQLFSILLGQLIFSEPELCNQLIKSFEYKWYQKGPYEFILTYQIARLNKDNECFRHLFNDQKCNDFANKVNYINYLHSEYLLCSDNDSSLFYVDKYIQLQHNNENIYSAKLLKLWYYYLHDNTEMVNQIITEIDHLPKDNLSAKDKQVLNELASFSNWNKTILRARLFYDCGDSDRALKELLSIKSSVNTLNNYQAIEYSYRLARIYDGLKEFKKAQSLYAIVIKSELDNECYFPAYAAYYIGKTFEQQNDINMAVKYYKICQETNSPIYESNIHQKAEQAIVQCQQDYKTSN